MNWNYNSDAVVANLLVHKIIIEYAKRNSVMVVIYNEVEYY